MKTALVCLVVLVSFLGSVQGEQINPGTDVLTKNADGEYVTIFGPDSFYSDLLGFHNPLVIVNGTAIIGGK